MLWELLLLFAVLSHSWPALQLRKIKLTLASYYLL
jgi:hypothetical protein